MKLDNRLMFLVVGIVAIVALVGGWFLGVQPQITSAAATDAQLATTETQNQLTRTQLASLKAAQSKLPELSDQLAKLKSAVPDGVDGSKLLAEVSAIAASNGVTVSAFGLGTPVSYVAPTASVTAAAPAPATTDSTNTASTSAAAAPAATAVSPLLPYTDGAITGSNFAVIDFTTAVTAGTSQPLLNFVQALQSGERLVLLTSSELAASGVGKDQAYTLTVSGRVYMTRSSTTASTPASTTTSPSAGATPAPTTTPSPSGSASPTPTPSPTSTKKP